MWSQLVGGLGLVGHGGFYCFICRGRVEGLGEKLPLARPFPQSVFEDLQDCWPDVVFGVEPREGDVWVKGRLPFETAVGFQFHAEERIGQTREVIIIDARIDKCRWQADLSDVVLDGELGAPKRQSGPTLAVNAVVGHAAVDVVLDAGFLGGVGQSPADGHLVAPEGGVDKGQLGAGEEVRYEGLVFEGADDEADVLERFQLLCHEAIFRSQLGADLVSHGGGDAREGSRLSAGGVDDDNCLGGHPGLRSGECGGR